LKRLGSKGIEVQDDDVRTVAKEAALSTYALARRPLFVEDSGLYIKSLNGFPGPYSSYVYRALGLEAVLRLLRGSESRDAVFVCAVALCMGKSSLKVFEGRLEGHISATERGSNGFGYDPIFVPRGSRQTFAQMETAQKSAISHRFLALRSMADWLSKRGRAGSHSLGPGNIYQPKAKESEH
jgi:XTP/dITP diphosphohydrolase